MATRSRLATAIGPEPTNGGQATIDASKPWRAVICIVGVADMLFHRWNVEEVAAKGGAAKGSKAKKTDNIESYVWRLEGGNLALPGEYLRQSLIGAARFRQDPRSPRKSAADLYKAGIIVETHLADLGQKEWDYEHRCRVTIQRNGITRCRPALKAGWRAEFTLTVNLPEYISPTDLHELANMAGRLIGVADFRPSYGRYLVESFETLED